MLHLKPYLPNPATLFIFDLFSLFPAQTSCRPFLFSLHRHTSPRTYPCTHFSSEDVRATLHFRPSAYRGGLRLQEHVRRMFADTRSARKPSQAFSFWALVESLNRKEGKQVLLCHKMSLKAMRGFRKGPSWILPSFLNAYCYFAGISVAVEIPPRILVGLSIAQPRAVSLSMPPYYISFPQLLSLTIYESRLAFHFTYTHDFIHITVKKEKWRVSSVHSAQV